MAQNNKRPKPFKDVLEEIKGQRILVANRGIPARRIARTIREMSDAIPVMTATDVDKTSPATTGVQELMLLGENPRAYLDIDRIIRKAKARGIVAIHPGWGFSAEDDTFPEKCRKAGIKFIGPLAEPMRILGNKVQVRALAKKLGVPVVPGSEGAGEHPRGPRDRRRDRLSRDAQGRGRRRRARHLRGVPPRAA